MHIYQIIQTRRPAKNFFPTHKSASWPMLYGEQASICIFASQETIEMRHNAFPSAAFSRLQKSLQQDLSWALVQVGA